MFGLGKGKDRSMKMLLPMIQSFLPPEKIVEFGKKGIESAKAELAKKLDSVELQEGETMVTYMLFQADGKTIAMLCTMREDGDQLLISRAIEQMEIEALVEPFMNVEAIAKILEGGKDV